MWPLVALALAQGHDIVPADLFTLDAVGGVAVGATHAVFVRSRWDEALDKTNRDLWSVELASGLTTRLTFRDADEHSPRLSADGRDVYFVTPDEQKKPQVFRMPLAGGPSQQVTRAPDGVSIYDLDGDAVWYVSDKAAPVDDAFAGLRKSHPMTYGHAARQHSTVFRLDLRSWRVETVLAAGRNVYAFDVAPGGARFAAITAPSEALETREGGSEVLVWDAATRAAHDLPDDLFRAQAPNPHGWLDGLAWSDDGGAVVFRVDFDGWNGETYVAEPGASPEADRVWKIPRDGVSHELALAWAPRSRELCLTGAWHGRDRVYCYADVARGQVGKARSFPEGDVVVRDFAFTPDGKSVLLDLATPERFGELYVAPTRGRPTLRRLTDLNPHTADWKLPSMQAVTWTAPDGVEVEGFLELPFGWTPEQGPLPFVLGLHGGPTAHQSFARRFRTTGETWLAASGYAVLWPNYRGSTSYGDRFVAELVGRENEVEVADLLAGVDAMVARGIADPARLAVGGWSNGGYLTACLTVATDRFKAASLGAGVVDQVLQWATEDTPSHVTNFMQGEPWTAIEAYLAASPLARADRVKTPTLIHVGEDDPRVPQAHARAWFRALDTYLDVPVELVVYPGAGHGLRLMSQIKAKMAWDAAWFERWVLGRAAAAPPPAPVSSP